MELKPGYKQTEVGEIPEDWTLEPLKNLGKVASGKRLPLGNYLTRKETPYPYIRVTDMRGGSISQEDIQYVPIDVYPAIKQYRIFVDDIFISVAGTLGIVGKIPQSLNGANLTENANRITSIKCNRDYLLFFLRSNSIQNTIDSIRTVGAQPKLALTRIRKFQIPLPPTKTEQEAIAGALSDADELIASLEQLIEKKRMIKQGAMQELLTGKKRLPGFQQKPGYKQTEFGKIPEDWVLKRLFELVDPSRSIRYGIVQPGKYDHKGRFMIRGQDYSESKGWAADADIFRVSAEVEERYKKARLKHGDLIMTIVGYCGHVEIIPKWLDGANLTQTTARIAIRSELASSMFSKFFLQSSIAKKQVNTFIKGAAQPGLNCGDVEQFFIALPERAEQEAIASVLSDMDTDIEALEKKLEKARKIKAGMMHNLLTGTIRLV